MTDIIVTNSPQSVIYSDSIPCTVADHELVTATINLKKPKRAPVFKTFRDLRFYSSDTFCDLLRQESTELDKIFATDNVETQVDIFTRCFTKCLNECAPLVNREIRRSSAPWINADLQGLMRERNITHMRIRMTGIMLTCRMNIRL